MSRGMASLLFARRNTTSTAVRLSYDPRVVGLYVFESCETGWDIVAIGGERSTTVEQLYLFFL